jgi:hypothetical protein
MTDEKFQKESQDENADSQDSAISRAVEIGYKVIEEQIQQGQKIAEQLGSTGIDSSLMNGDTAEIGERVLRFYSDIGALWFEMLESVSRNPALSDLYSKFVPGANGRENGLAKNGAAKPAMNGRSDMSIEIVCSEPTGARVSVDLHSQYDFDSLMAQPLHAPDSDKPPISDIHFDVPLDGWASSLRITIPEGHPPGTYSGLILNTATEEPAGTLCVHIPSQKKDQKKPGTE